MLGRHDEGDALRSRSLALREAIVRAEPGSKYDRERLCFTYFNMALTLESTKPDLALEFDAKAKEQREILLRAEPDDVESRVDLAGIYGHIARVLSFKKDRAGQYAALAKARTLYEDALRRLPELEQARDDLSKVLVHLGRLLVEDGRDAEARPALRRASELLERLAEENPQFVGFANELTMLSFNEADVLARLGRVDEADAVLDRERARREARLKAAPGPAAKVLTARVAREMEQSTFPGLRHRAPVEEWRGRVLELLEEVVRDEPKDRVARVNLAFFVREKGPRRRPRGAAARPSGATRGRPNSTRGSREDPKNIYYRGGFFDASSDRAAMLARLGHDAEAIAAFEAVVPLTDALLAEKVTSVRVSRRTDQDAYIAALGWKTGKITPAEAVARLGAALDRAAKTPFATPEVFASLARCHATRARTAGVPGSGRTADDGRSDIRTAADLLRRAVAAGYPAPDLLTDPDFAAVLDSPEAPMLREDFAMPSKPFARPGS